MKVKLGTLLISWSLSCLAYQPVDGDVNGKIMNLRNQPVAGVHLVFTSEQKPDYKAEASTKNNGSFSLKRVPLGSIIVVAEKEGYVTRTYAYEQEQDRTRALFRMAKTDTTLASLGPQPKVSGVLRGQKGKPIALADLRLTTQDLAEYGHDLKTDEQGYFEALSLTYAEIQIHAKKEGYRDQLYRFTQGKKDYKVKNYSMQSLVHDGLIRTDR